MTPDQLRAAYLDFFQRRDHRLVASSPVIPEQDPTLMFANSGMNQFKDMLLGHETRDYKRAVSVQKCVRAGGKHNDLDDVGKDARHLTFFEMLGNWSFGDYYKRDAIHWAWEFVTQVLKLDVARLYVTTHRQDDESYAIWRDEIGVRPERILKLGDKENFWAMGPTGPCGPCTEIHYDTQPELGALEPFVEGYDDDRVIEIWNLVFMESNRELEDGPLVPLPMQSVDTGMGLDRAAMMLAGARSVFHTALFSPIFRATLDLQGRQDLPVGPSFYGLAEFSAYAVIADHVRTVTFALCDGAKFSNEGRGSVLRRILRRAVRHGRELGFEQPFMWQVAQAVIDSYRHVYPELGAVGQEARQLIRLEEASFFKTLDRGIALFERAVAHAREHDQQALEGKVIFDLYATFGFPPDLTEIMAQERGMTADMAGYEDLLAQHQAVSRGKDVYAEAAGLGEWQTVHEGSADQFMGYQALQLQTQLRKVRQQEDAQLVEVTLAQTPFYAESGGQVGDQGVIQTLDGELVLEVFDVQKAPIGILHKARITRGSLLEADLTQPVLARVDATMRAQTMANHTATHLLHAALRAHVSAKVVQAGSRVEPGRLRFDFTHDEPLSHAQLRLLEDTINAQIRQDHPVTIHVDVPRDVAVDQMGAMAIFGEKYGDQVRVVEIPGQSVELCGGTHVQRTRDIGLLRITSESGVAAGIRRVEAVTQQAAYEAFQHDRERLEQTAQLLKTSPNQLQERTHNLLRERQELHQQLQKLSQRLATLEVHEIVAQATQVGPLKVVSRVVRVEQREQLLAYADRLRERLGQGLVLLGSEIDGKAALLCLVTDEALKAHKGLKAGDLINAVAHHVEGRGGGKPGLAQAGGARPEGLPHAIAAFEDAARAALGL